MSKHVMRCRHGLRVATERDLRAWYNRPHCRADERCGCPDCAPICWQFECLEDPLCAECGVGVIMDGGTTCPECEERNE